MPLSDKMFKATQEIKTTGKTDWLGLENAIRAVIFDVYQDESCALDGIRAISDIIGKTTGRGYPWNDLKLRDDRLNSK